MKRIRHVSAACAFLLACQCLMHTAQAAPLAELVPMWTSDRVLLHALLYSPAAASNQVVIHVPGGPGAFYSIQNLAPVAEKLNANGYHFLSINTRTAGTNGMLYARFEDYALDVAAAVQFAKQRGLSNIVLMGQSLSSARVVYYLDQSHEPAINGLVLTAAIPSPYLEAQARWNEEQREVYDAFLAEQRQKIASGNELALASWPWWGNDRMLELSAATWISVFGTPDESNASTVKFAAGIELPVLLVHGSMDEAVAPAVAEQVLAAFSHSPNAELQLIAGAKHLFLGFEPQLAEAVVGWLLTTFPEKVEQP